jgi:serine/threonine protein kinase
MKPRLISEGTYGCVFHPGFKCNNSQENVDVKYVTKIHSNINSSIVKNEIAISQKIRDNIPDFDLYFSPVIKTCKVDLAKSDAAKCKLIKDKTVKTFESTEMKYIDGKTLFKHVEHLMKQGKIQSKIYAEIATLYKRLCISIEKLQTINVVHFDLKSDNIIVTNSGTPIVIDFGISIDMDIIIREMFKTPQAPVTKSQQQMIAILSKSSSTAAAAVATSSSPKSHSANKAELYKLLDTKFYAFSTEYTPWCIDIVLICFILQKQKHKEIIKTEQIMQIFDEVMQKNKFADKIYLRDALKEYRAKFQEVVASKYGNTENVNLLNHLLQNFAKWDLYSVTILFMEMLEKIKQNPNSNHVKEIKKNLGFLE